MNLCRYGLLMIVITGTFVCFPECSMEMPLFIKGIDGSRYIDVTSDATIADVREQIQGTRNRTKGAPYIQLQFAGRTLSDDETLPDLGISSQSVLNHNSIPFPQELEINPDQLDWPEIGRTDQCTVDWIFATFREITDAKIYTDVLHNNWESVGFISRCNGTYSMVYRTVPWERGCGNFQFFVRTTYGGFIFIKYFDNQNDPLVVDDSDDSDDISSPDVVSPNNITIVFKQVVVWIVIAGLLVVMLIMFVQKKLSKTIDDHEEKPKINNLETI